MGRSKCAPISSLAPTDEPRSCAKKRDCRRGNSALQWMFSGSGYGELRRTLPGPWDGSTPEESLSRLIAAIIGSAAMSLPKASSKNYAGKSSKSSESRSLSLRLTCKTEFRGWGDAELLTVRVNRLQEWFRPGLLCIGDAAHAMSPVGGVGINLAIQDAVAAAN